MTKKSYLLLGLLLILALSACSNPTEIATQTQSPAVELTSEYPAPPVVNVDNPAYPGPQTEPTVAVTPQPTYTTDPQMGIVKGKLLVNNNGVNNVTLYLAAVRKDKTGKDVVAGLSLANSPNIVTDQDGVFSFINVKAGRYALILDIVTTQYMINYPDKSNPILIDVESGKVVDIGELNYDSLPLPDLK